jgi:hypothetical protein
MTTSSFRVERRRFGRRWCTLHAYLRMSSGRRLDCVVCNISERGAFVEGYFPTLPINFNLVIEAIGVDVECQLKRQVEQGAGLFFLEFVDLPNHMPRRLQGLRPLDGSVAAKDVREPELVS